MAWRATVELQAWGVSLLLLACGGRSSEGPVSDGGAPSNDSGGSSGGSLSSGSTSGGAQQPNASGAAAGNTMNAGTGSGGRGGAAPTNMGGAAGGAGGGCTKPACKLSAEPSPLWVTNVPGSGRGPAAIHFSDSDELVHVAAGEYKRESTTLDRVTGEIKAAAQAERGIVAEDASGRRLARVIENDEYVVTLDGAETFRFPGAASSLVQFSPDGSAIGAYSCVSDPAELIQLKVYDTGSGEMLATAPVSAPCIYGDLTMLVDAKRRRTLFAHPARSELFVLDWYSETVATLALHESAPVSAAPRNHEGTILNLKLSPNGRALVSVGAADGLAWLNPDTLAVEFRVPDVPFFNIYDQCYCTYLSESPVSWSPSGDIYATAHASGGIALRDAATHEDLGVLEPPKDAEVIRLSQSTGFGPALIQFSPDMRHLVALYPRVAVGYSLTQE